MDGTYFPDDAIAAAAGAAGDVWAQAKEAAETCGGRRRGATVGRRARGPSRRCR